MFPESNQYQRLDTRVFAMLAVDKERAMDEAKNAKEEHKEFLQKKADIARTDEQFLEIMNSIFSSFDLQGGRFVINQERFSSSHAKSEIQKIIKYIVDDIEDYKREIEEWERQQKEIEDEQRWKQTQTESEEESDVDRLVRQSLQNKDEEQPVQKKSYDEMTISEIQQEIENAVEEENYELAAELKNKYLKGESKKVWDMELKRIFEKLHIRR